MNENFSEKFDVMIKGLFSSFPNISRQLRPVYTKRQRQRCDHSTMMLAILFSLKSMETLENGLQTHSGASLQSCCSVDADAWCKRALIDLI